MKRFTTMALAAALSMVLVGSARAQDAKAVVDKAIKAAGGEEKLSKLGVITWKAKGKFTFGGNESDVNTQVIAQGNDRFRMETSGEGPNGQFRFVRVLAGDKGWRLFRDAPNELDADGLANAKRDAYLEIVPVTLVALKSPGFKLEKQGDENVNGKPATTLKVTAADGKTFKLAFDVESGLPVKLVADVVGPGGMEYTRETTFGAYKEFDGIKKATKIENKRDGEPFQTYEVTEFKVLEKAPADAFTEPK